MLIRTKYGKCTRYVIKVYQTIDVNVDNLLIFNIMMRGIIYIYI